MRHTLGLAWFASLVLCAGCTLTVPAAPEQRVALPQPCAEGQIPMAGATWSCQDPSKLYSAVPVDHANQATYADTADYADTASEATYADVALGFSSTASLTLGASAPLSGSSGAALNVVGGADLLGQPIRFLILNDRNLSASPIEATPGAPANLSSSTFVLPSRPGSNQRTADTYTLRVRIGGTVEGAGDPSAQEFTTCRFDASVTDGTTTTPVAFAETSAFGRTATGEGSPMFPVLGEGTVNVSAPGTYWVLLSLSVEGGVGANQKCFGSTGNTGPSVTVEGR